MFRQSEYNRMKKKDFTGVLEVYNVDKLQLMAPDRN